MADQELSQIVDALQDAVQKVLSGSASDDSSDQEFQGLQEVTKIANSLDAFVVHHANEGDYDSMENLLSPLIFSLFSSLSPLLGMEPLQDIALSLFGAISYYCSPRELCVALQERLELLSRPLDSDEPQEDSSDEGDVTKRNKLWNPMSELISLTHVVGEFLPKLRTKKPEMFLEPISNAFLSALNYQVHLHARVESAEDMELISIKLWQKFCELCLTARLWASKGARKEVSQVSDLFLNSIRIISPYLPLPVAEGSSSSLAEFVFLRDNSKYRIPNVSSDKKHQGNDPPQYDKIWKAIEATRDPLYMDITPKSQESASVGAFIILVKAKFDSAGRRWDASLDDVQSFMPLLLAGLKQGTDDGANTRNEMQEKPSSQPRLTAQQDLADCVLVWLQCSLNATRLQHLPEENLLPLCHALSLHASLSAIPSHRHISLHLMKQLLDSFATDDAASDFLKDTIAESPFPQLRSAAIGVLKQLWLAKDSSHQSQHEDASTSRSELLSPRTFDQLQPLLFQLPTPVPEAPTSASTDSTKGQQMYHLSSYLTSHLGFLIEALNLLFLLLRHPRLGDTLGLKSRRLIAIKLEFMDPLDGFVQGWTKFVTEDAEEEVADNDISTSLSLLRLNIDNVCTSLPE
ncbi:unnamed protein product [Sympodiomycopsis kandeliae]